MSVASEPPEDRIKPGTKAHRANRLPLGVKVRYWIVMGALLTVAVGSWIAWHNTTRLDSLAHRVAADEHSTCLIQQRGLPAGHELAASMADIHELLTQPPRPGAPPTPPRVAAIVRDLNRHLGAYSRLEAGQPPTRAC